MDFYQFVVSYEQSIWNGVQLLTQAEVCSYELAHEIIALDKFVLDIGVYIRLIWSSVFHLILGILIAVVKLIMNFVIFVRDNEIDFCIETVGL